MNDEQWRPVVGAKGFYEVSDQGRVRSVDRVCVVRNRWGGVSPRQYRGRVLRANPNNNGYLLVEPRVGIPDRTPRLVHRMVAEAFLPVVVGKDFVNHNDGDKTNNRATNLEWCTRSENMGHAHVTGLVDAFKIPVVATCLRTGRERRFESQFDAEMELRGKATSAVHHCLRGRLKSAYGFAWRPA